MHTTAAVSPAAVHSVEVGQVAPAAAPASVPTPASAAPGQSELQLTRRERDVLAALSRGLRYREISRELDVSINTVRTHIRSLYGKLEVNDKYGAMESAQRLGLMQFESIPTDPKKVLG